MMRATSLNRQTGARHTRTTLEPSLMMSALARTSGSRRKTRCCDSRIADLTTAAETWIRLYESALARANAAELKVAGQVGIKA